MPKKEEGKGLGIASFVLGLLSLIGFWLFFIAIPMAVLSIIFSILQFRKNKTGLAIAGLILGILGLIASAAIGAFIILTFSLFSGRPELKYPEIEKSIVLIKTSAIYLNNDGIRFKSPGGGSGVIFNEEGSRIFVITNRHVIDCLYTYSCSQMINQTISVMLHTGEILPVIKSYIAPNKIDLTILEVQANKGSNYSIASITKEGSDLDLVYAIGYPAFVINAREYSRSSGRITGFRELITETGSKFKVIDSNAFIDFGSSGGGLFDSKGNLIGITTWGDRLSNAYAISISGLADLSTFKSCQNGAFYTDEGCAELCEGVLEDDLTCSLPCTDFYCRMEEIKGEMTPAAKMEV